MPYTDQKKKEVLEAIKKEPKTHVSKKYKVSLQTIRNWEKRTPNREAYAEITRDSKRVRELEQLVMRLIERLDRAGLL